MCLEEGFAAIKDEARIHSARRKCARSTLVRNHLEVVEVDMYAALYVDSSLAAPFVSLTL